MVETQPEMLDRVFLALGHPVRRQILVRLIEGPATVTDIAEPFEMSLNAISKHLKVLENANLIQREVVGREHYCSASPEPMEDVAEWLMFYKDFWTSQFDVIEQELLARKQARQTDRE